MAKKQDYNDGETPFSPDFSRVPFREQEPAKYRDDAPPNQADNPLYLAIPRPRSAIEVKALIEAKNPKFDAGVRNLPPELRRERVDHLDTVMFGLPRHARLEEMVMTTIRNSFAVRPWGKYYIEESAARANRIVWSKEEPSPYIGSVGSGAIFGVVGIGKSVILKCILMGCPQTILHSSFGGRQIGVVQIAWLYLSMPPKASTSALLIGIASSLDFILRTTTYRREVDAARNLSEAVRIVASKLAVHAVGVIFCDEVQNIRVGSSTERGTFENTLQELINYTHTRWVLIGTGSSRSSVKSEALLRRMVGERGQINWGPLPPGIEWNEFIGGLWKRHVTKTPTPLTADLSEFFRRLCGGVPDYAKKLFAAAQINVIGKAKDPNEQLTAEVLLGTMTESFADLHRRLEPTNKAKEFLKDMMARQAIGRDGNPENDTKTDGKPKKQK